ncbi:MAG: ABC transporter ATP-binding protein [Achromobacter sp.]|jgi:ATP-binding cassette subfamily B protein IrtB|uniref:Lipid A export ATP-binding/permease protein MsbA n=1 Tax=Achromobacter insuavis TaxID=1287735 RepID=A0A6J5BD12_9BURK|nr:MULTISPECIES: ABC transporter ATP-binding protein [Achromobacter]MBN9639312.1 ABC transporter ATP-binding protein [Achromobacter sp.]CAB3701414.1 Lipid A export ATP-binding/permease protein MsbA [Achromobacter insuavis]CUI41831.1 Lipid A export ATP-binding/permease protein MsbA [Achromobacter sp. 2789STDY5608628]CUI48387.1 Lipid A export ATP-binding/permease protein MsbA [Achromobacter sp. 2789STDY5608633]
MTTRPASWRETYLRLMRSAGGQARRLRASLLQLALAAVFQGLALACVAPLFLHVAHGDPWPAAAAWLAALSGLALAATALRWRAQGFDYGGHMARATHELRVRLGEQLRRMPLETLQAQRTGGIAAKLLGGVDEQMNYALTVINLILGAIITPAVAALALLALDWRIGVALLLVFPLIIPLYRWRRPALDRGARDTGRANEALNAELLEYMQGLPVCLATGRAGAANERLRQGFEQLERLQRQAHRRGAKPTLMVVTLVEAGLLAILACGALWVTQGSLDPALLAAVLVLVVRFAEPLAMFVSFTAIFALIEAALARVEEVLAVAPLPQWPAQGAPSPQDGIRIEQLDFQYAAGSAPALRGIDLDLPARGLTALVGPSGSGKTTLTRLLMRHADPQRGAVRIGGVDIRSLSPADLNRLVSTVFQDVHLFDDTVLSNIGMARPEASEAEIRAAARAAHCLDLIERLPQGWQTRLGEAGGTLSGGERQRLSIARAILKNAPILILDEPTAALDTESELAVQAAIDALVPDRSVIVIAHRLSTIVAADRILVFEEGRITQRGTHAQLLATAGRYRQMWRAQQG